MIFEMFPGGPVSCTLRFPKRLIFLYVRQRRLKKLTDTVIVNRCYHARISKGFQISQAVIAITASWMTDGFKFSRTVPTTQCLDRDSQIFSCIADR